mmetsp:Transcript_34821/g.74169  ORF Transcript_34821/g.74169 Transcript_34821/m.74169 type:complete len:335 (+) Transcript_34821:590-1594(+)
MCSCGGRSPLRLVRGPAEHSSRGRASHKDSSWPPPHAMAIRRVGRSLGARRPLLRAVGPTERSCCRRRPMVVAVGPAERFPRRHAAREGSPGAIRRGRRPPVLTLRAGDGRGRLGMVLPPVCPRGGRGPEGGPVRSAERSHGRRAAREGLRLSPRPPTAVGSSMGRWGGHGPRRGPVASAVPSRRGRGPAVVGVRSPERSPRRRAVRDGLHPPPGRPRAVRRVGHPWGGSVHPCVGRGPLVVAAGPAARSVGRRVAAEGSWRVPRVCRVGGGVRCCVGCPRRCWMCRPAGRICPSWGEVVHSFTKSSFCCTFHWAPSSVSGINESTGCKMVFIC